MMCGQCTTTRPFLGHDASTHHAARKPGLVLCGAEEGQRIWLRDVRQNLPYRSVALKQPCQLCMRTDVGLDKNGRFVRVYPGGDVQGS